MILPLHVFRRSAYSYDLSLWFGGDGCGVGALLVVVLRKKLNPVRFLRRTVLRRNV